MLETAKIVHRLYRKGKYEQNEKRFRTLNILSQFQSHREMKIA